MRLKAMALVPILAMVALGMSSSAASAAPNPVVTAEQFGPVEYNDIVLGPVKCGGWHYTNSVLNPGNATSGGRDTETCTARTADFKGNGKQLQGVGGGQETTCYCGVEGQIQDPFYGWQSDYFTYVKGLTVLANFMVGKVSENGHSIKLEAKYTYVPEPVS